MIKDFEIYKPTDFDGYLILDRDKHLAAGAANAKLALFLGDLLEQLKKIRFEVPNDT